MPRHASPHRTVRRSRGFTLVELMTATSIAGVLASVAYPSFTGAVQKARRGEALVALMQVQQAQERFRSNGSRYGSLAELGLPATAAGGRYALDVDAPNATGYTAVAVAQGAQAADAACRYMQVNVAAGAWAMSSGPTAAAGNDEAANRRCWNL